ncbi:MAG TPA: serine hydroxymethyltransferase [Patescibacteria group bacterium]|nr:serine hydroxymethyltransferase [Patescibacteria group bacterium]
MKNLQNNDSEIFDLIKAEGERQKNVLEMIPSENYVSPSVLDALGSVLTNKYSEGYPKKRYYQGNAVADQVEIVAQERAKTVFDVPYVNVQPLSGSPANLAVYVALLEPLKDKIMGLSLAFGGHLTHGQPQSATGRFFKSVQYTLGEDSRLDYDAIEAMAIREKPKIIVCGFTAYPRVFDFKRFAQIADKVDAYLMADISHVAGLVAAGVHPSPVKYAHIVTTTIHKTLRGPRGAMIMVTERGLKKNKDLPKLIDMAIIPGLQGGPHDNQTAAIAVALKEASEPEFKKYCVQIVLNAKKLADELRKYKFNIVSGGTDNHLLLIDLTNKKVNGAVAALALEQAGIIVNKNGVPFDKMPPFYPSGIRLGTPAITTRGMKERDMAQIAKWIDAAIKETKGMKIPLENKVIRKTLMQTYQKKIMKSRNLHKIAKEVQKFCSHYPLFAV